MTTTEALLWRITWTKAFPVVSQSIWSSNADDETPTSDSCADDSVWYGLAFHCLWNEFLERSKVAGWKRPLAIPSTYSLEGCTSRWSHSLGYGEITEGAVFQMMRHIRGLQRNEWGEPMGCQNIQTIADLGSGSGRVVLAVAMALQPKVAIGLEIVPAWHEFASQLWNAWNEECRLCGRENVTRLDFRCCDFTVDTEWWVHRADLVLVHGTVFEDALFEQVIAICRKTNVGTWIVSVSRPLISSKPWNGHGLEFLSEFIIEMSWGRGIAFVYMVTLNHMEQEGIIV
jgi:Histone methylation protein DOT1